MLGFVHINSLKRLLALPRDRFYNSQYLKGEIEVSCIPPFGSKMGIVVEFDKVRFVNHYTRIAINPKIMGVAEEGNLFFRLVAEYILGFKHCPTYSRFMYYKFEWPSLELNVKNATQVFGFKKIVYVGTLMSLYTLAHHQKDWQRFRCQCEHTNHLRIESHSINGHG